MARLINLWVDGLAKKSNGGFMKWIAAGSLNCWAHDLVRSVVNSFVYSLLCSLVASLAIKLIN